MKVRNLLGMQEETEQEQPVPDFCMPKTRVGLEYEWENCGEWPLPVKKYVGMLEGNPAEQLVADGQPSYIKEVVKYFNVHVDGSLRKNGMEFTFKNGFSGSKILNATRSMDECSRILGFEATYRTSLHCHLDMQDTNFPSDVEQLGAVYCVVEPFLYQFVGNNRNVSNYCIPWYKHPQHFENFRDTIKRKYKPEQAGLLVHAFRGHVGDKYAGLNCFSLGTFGTLEFRQGQVNMQLAKLHTWINMLMRLKQWVLTTPMTPTEVLDKVNSARPSVFLQEVFQSNYADAVRMSRNIDADLWSGLETLYQYIACG